MPDEPAPPMPYVFLTSVGWALRYESDGKPAVVYLDTTHPNDATEAYDEAASFLAWR